MDGHDARGHAAALRAPHWIRAGRAFFSAKRRELHNVPSTYCARLWARTPATGFGRIERVFCHVFDGRLFSPDTVRTRRRQCSKTIRLRDDNRRQLHRSRDRKQNTRFVQKKAREFSKRLYSIVLPDYHCAERYLNKNESNSTQRLTQYKRQSALITDIETKQAYITVIV